MNQQHLKALLDSEGPRMVIESSGRIICTDGRIAAECDGYPLTPDAKGGHNIQRFRQLWDRCSGEEGLELEPLPGALRDGSRRVLRFFHSGELKAAIQEAFYRTFDGPTTRWFWSGKTDAPLLVREDGRLMAIVMPIVCGNENPDPSLILTDSAVFEPFATEGNAYYLQGDGVLLRQIKDLTIQINDIRGKLTDLEAEKEDAERDLRHKESILLKRRAEGAL